MIAEFEVNTGREHNIRIEYEVHGKFIPATYYEPPEYPELVVLKYERQNEKGKWRDITKRVPPSLIDAIDNHYDELTRGEL